MQNFSNLAVYCKLFRNKLYGYLLPPSGLPINGAKESPVYLVTIDLD
jgi:hypothetical protein